MSIRYLSFFTSGPKGGGYEQLEPDWRASIVTHKRPDDDVLCHDVGEIEEWRAATMQKAAVCLHAFRELPEGRDLVWLDIDARAMGPMDLFHTLTGDFAFRWHTPNYRPDGEVLSGTLFFKSGSKAALGLLVHWKNAADKAARYEGDQRGVFGDQVVLQKVFAEHRGRPGFTWDYLPPAYCYIYDIDPRQGTECEPVIVHHQESRHRAIGRGGHWGRAQP